MVKFAGRTLFVNPNARCPECETAAERDREERERESLRHARAAESERRQEGILDLLHQAGVNAWDHGHATLDNFDPVDAGAAPVQAARAFLADLRAAEQYTPVRGLYLVGDTGAGKSHLAVAVARALLLDPAIRPEEVVFDHALRLIGQIQRTYSNEESADAVLARRINARVWILDDLGTEAPSADVVRRLTEIFTERAMRPTLVTSNLAPDQLEARHSEFFRVVSRLGPRYFRTVRVPGRDRRFIAPEV